MSSSLHGYHPYLRSRSQPVDRSRAPCNKIFDIVGGDEDENCKYSSSRKDGAGALIPMSAPVAAPRRLPPRHTPRDSRTPKINPTETADLPNFLRDWRPPTDHYRRRRTHPSLSYPSRRPSLPSLLEEREVGGVFFLVRPELAVCTNHRSNRWPSTLGIGRPSTLLPLPIQSTPTIHHMDQAFDDDSDEELDAWDDDDSDISDDSDCDSEGIITPTGSPTADNQYFLQPLLLSKP